MCAIDEVGRVQRTEELRLRNAGVGLIKRSLRFRHRSYALDTAPSNSYIVTRSSVLFIAIIILFILLLSYIL